MSFIVCLPDKKPQLLATVEPSKTVGFAKYLRKEILPEMEKMDSFCVIQTQEELFNPERV